MNNYTANKVIFVLESPWDLYKGDANKASVLPFIEGLAGHDGKMEVFHANFYDKNSFICALLSLCQIKFDNAIVYIAGHGDTDEIAGVKTADLIKSVGVESRKYNITGVMLGACLAGADSETLKEWTRGTNIKWIAGYSTSVYWLEGTMIDCAILSRMSNLDSDDFTDEAAIVEGFAEAIAPFSRSSVVGTRDKQKTRFDDAMEFVVRPAKQGAHPKVVTDRVFDAWEEEQLSDRA